ncbi:MAG: GNAT family N-acetyltransferase [Firmicutes bacterium]|nr:GNAT family N-acetyltransferase [Bacillota bacterium]
MEDRLNPTAHTEQSRIEALIERLGLGKITDEIRPVTGGLMHRMYRIQTEKGVFAMKALNPQIMKRPEAKQNFAKAEELEQILEDHGLPIVPALRFDGKKMQEEEGHYYYLYDWHRGRITDWNTISEDQCFRVGQILGQMHRIDAKNVPPEEFDFAPIDFSGFLTQAKEQGSPLADLLSDHLAVLEKAQESILSAGKKLPSMSAISDGDMDPKNVMWLDGIPSVIDLECLDLANPMRALIELSLQWAGTVTGLFRKENLRAFFLGYLETYDNGYRSYEQIYGLAYQNWVEWLEYNLGRALGKEDPDEVILGESEVKNTLKIIDYLDQQEEVICRFLKEELPPVDPKKFDTHDGNLCYFEILFEGSLDNIPDYSLPEGYRFVLYQPGDKDAWIEIEKSAKEFSTEAQGEDAWKRYYENHEDILPERMFFVENASGEKVATATAFFDIHGRDTSGDGWLHWVAVRREEQGKGLSKPLITRVLKEMRKLGYTRAKIPTQTTTWLACKVYYDLGFRPVPKNLENSRAGWKMLEQLAGIQVNA